MEPLWPDKIRIQIVCMSDQIWWLIGKENRDSVSSRKEYSLCNSTEQTCVRYTDSLWIWVNGHPTCSARLLAEIGRVSHVTHTHRTVNVEQWGCERVSDAIANGHTEIEELLASDVIESSLTGECRTSEERSYQKTWLSFHIKLIKLKPIQTMH